jgi:phage shock protein PspC (stress-responsive transcriptional regulator)
MPKPADLPLDQPDALLHAQRRARRPQSGVRLTRSRTGRLAGGVCAGIAAFIGCRPLPVRLIFLLTVIVTAGVSLLIYGLFWLLLPQAPINGWHT